MVKTPLSNQITQHINQIKLLNNKISQVLSSVKSLSAQSAVVAGAGNHCTKMSTTLPFVLVRATGM